MGNFAVSAGEELYQFDQVDFLLFIISIISIIIIIKYTI